MKTAFTDEQAIDVAPDVVWSRLTDWAQAVRWMPGVASMRPDGPLAPGTSCGSSHAGRSARRRSPRSSRDGRSPSALAGGVTADYTYTVRPGSDGGATVAGLEALVGRAGS